MDQNGPFWPEEVHFGPFRSANRTPAIPEGCFGAFSELFVSHFVLEFKTFGGNFALRRCHPNKMACGTEGVSNEVPGISARMTPGCPWDARPKNFLFGLIFRS